MLLLSWFPCALLVTDEKDSSESLWPCITKWTLMELNHLTTLVNVFYWFFLLECSNDFKCYMQIWACAVKLFENIQKLVGLQPLNCQFQIQIQIPLTTLSISISNFKIQIQIRKQFCFSWYAGGRGNTTQTSEAVRSKLWFPFFEIKSNQHKFWQSKPPRQMKIFNFKNFPQ